MQQLPSSSFPRDSRAPCDSDELLRAHRLLLWALIHAQVQTSSHLSRTCSLEGQALPPKQSQREERPLLQQPRGAAAAPNMYNSSKRVEAAETATPRSSSSLALAAVAQLLGDGSSIFCLSAEKGSNTCSKCLARSLVSCTAAAPGGPSKQRAMRRAEAKAARLLKQLQCLGGALLFIAAAQQRLCALLATKGGSPSSFVDSSSPLPTEAATEAAPPLPLGADAAECLVLLRQLQGAAAAAAASLREAQALSLSLGESIAVATAGAPAGYPAHPEVLRFNRHEGASSETANAGTSAASTAMAASAPRAAEAVAAKTATQAPRGAFTTGALGAPQRRAVVRDLPRRSRESPGHTLVAAQRATPATMFSASAPTAGPSGPAAATLQQSGGRGWRPAESVPTGGAPCGAPHARSVGKLPIVQHAPMEVPRRNLIWCSHRHKSCESRELGGRMASLAGAREGPPARLAGISCCSRASSVAEDARGVQKERVGTLLRRTQQVAFHGRMHQQQQQQPQNGRHLGRDADRRVQAAPPSPAAVQPQESSAGTLLEANVAGWKGMGLCYVVGVPPADGSTQDEAPLVVFEGGAPRCRAAATVPQTPSVETPPGQQPMQQEQLRQRWEPAGPRSEQGACVFWRPPPYQAHPPCPFQGTNVEQQDIEQHPTGGIGNPRVARRVLFLAPQAPGVATWDQQHQRRQQGLKFEEGLQPSTSPPVPHYDTARSCAGPAGSRRGPASAIREFSFQQSCSRGVCASGIYARRRAAGSAATPIGVHARSTVAQASPYEESLRRLKQNARDAAAAFNQHGL